MNNLTIQKDSIAFSSENHVIHIKNLVNKATLKVTKFLNFRILFNELFDNSEKT